MLLLAVPMTMMAQKPNGKDKFDPETHKQKQHQFMVEAAQLTEEESAKFFAVYDEMRQKEREIYGDSREMRKKRPESDEECRTAMLHADSLDIAIKQLQIEYHKRLLDIISPKKAMIAIMSGNDFDRMAFRDMMRNWKRGGKEKGDEPRPEMGGPRHNGSRHDGPFPGGPLPGDPAFEDANQGDK